MGTHLADIVFKCTEAVDPLTAILAFHPEDALSSTVQWLPGMANSTKHITVVITTRVFTTLNGQLVLTHRIR